MSSQPIAVGAGTIQGEYRADKPRFRGVSHQIAFFVFLAASCLLFILARGAGRTAVAVHGLSACFLFGTSALYHRGRWSHKAAGRMRRVDHSAIFVLIAGSYSPEFMLLSPSGNALILIWSFAGLGVLKALLWPDSPGWVTAALAIGVGWSGAAHLPALAPAMGTVSVALLIAAGIIYTVGGIVYATRRPDPLPKVFGYHEVFHLFVISGCITHFVHFVLVLRAAGVLG